MLQRCFFVRSWELGFLSSCTSNSALRYLTLLSHPLVNKQRDPAERKKKVEETVRQERDQVNKCVPRW